MDETALLKLQSNQLTECQSPSKTSVKKADSYKNLTGPYLNQEIDPRFATTNNPAEKYKISIQAEEQQ